jgi:cardiolipin synthase
MTTTTLLLMAGVAVEAAVLARVMLRPHREPASRIAWVAVVLALPLVGVAAYILFGEVNIGRWRVKRLRAVERLLPDAASLAPANQANLRAQIPERFAQLFRVGHSISGLDPVAGNSARLMRPSRPSSPTSTPRRNTCTRCFTSG